MTLLKNKGLWILTLCIALIGVGVAVAFHRVSANESGEKVNVEKTLADGRLSVTVKSLTLKESETLLEMRFDSEDVLGLDPVGPPSIRLPDGKVLESKAVEKNFINEDEPWKREYKLPAIPDSVDSVVINLASHITYDSATASTTIPLGKLLEDIDHSSVTSPKEYEAPGDFSLGEAVFAMDSVILKEGRFSLNYHPHNEAAKKMVIAGSLSHARLRDDLGNVYPSSSTIISFNEGKSWTRSQSLFFNGTINQEARSLVLELNGLGKIHTPGQLHVKLREDD